LRTAGEGARTSRTSTVQLAAATAIAAKPRPNQRGFVIVIVIAPW
jgi:hypothetical protein